jgi:hypothetical protein
MTGEQVLQAVCDYLQDVAGIADGYIVIDFAGNDRPDAAFVSVSMVSDVAVGMPSIVQGLVDIDGDDVFVEQSYSLRDARLGISGYGYQARAWLEAAEIRWREKRVGSPAQVLRAAGVRIYRTTPIQSRPVVTATDWEPRWAFDLLVYVDRTTPIGADPAAVDAAASVVLEADLTDQSGEILSFTATVEAP